MELVYPIQPVKKQTVDIMEVDKFTAMPTGVIAISETGIVNQMSEAACRITGRCKHEVLYEKYDEAIHGALALDEKFRFHGLASLAPEGLHEIKINRKTVRLTVMRDSISESVKTGFIMLLHDNDRLERETEHTIQKERLSAMGEITANIAHEIRNPLGCIELFASSLKNQGRQNGFGDQAETISKCVKSINSILSNINLFFKPEIKASLSKVDIHEHLNESLFFSKYLIQENENITIKKNYSDEPLVVNGDNELLKQMSMNIILNAIQSIRESGKIEITTNRIDDYFTGSSFVEICYADTGSGIKASNLNKVFDPYFTTKETGQGLGLPIAHNVVLQHNGTIQIRKRKQKGTLIRILLPLLNEKYNKHVA